LVHQGDKTLAHVCILAEQLRAKGMKVLMHIAPGDAASFKSQLRKADLSGALFACVLGEDELKEGKVSVKYLRERHEQVLIDFSSVASWLVDRV
jgi:histidyl-tRNA synthetase